MSDVDKTTPPMACTGCGSRWTDAELAERRAADPRILSCCPERDMQPIRLIQQRAHLEREITRIDAQLIPLREARTNAWRQKLNEMVSRRKEACT